jgi:phage-related protein
MVTEWHTEFLNDQVEAEFLALPADMQARLLKISELIEQFGLENLGMPYLRHITGKIWEMRAKGRSGISRALYVTMTGKRVIILRIFVKKTPQTPPSEIALALERIKEIDNG